MLEFFRRAMKRIRVSSSSGEYAVVCGRGALRRLGTLSGQLGECTDVFFLSSPRVWKLWGRRVTSSFGRRGARRPVLFDDRETGKNLRTVERICRELVRAGADRKALLVAVGGGVVGDVAGFAAACFLRGVRLVHVPTTLVAQVDSAIGGKTGVNLPEGKNLVGAFYPPQLVAADPGVLGTLPRRQYRSGLYEVIKYGVIGDRELFEFLERRTGDLLERKPAALDWVLERCIRAKAGIVSRDEKENSLRQVLNFGHTVGHALETATGYRRFLHGEAVGWGILAGAWVALESNRLARREAERIARLVARVGRLPRPERRHLRGLVGIMRADKKVRAGRLHWVLPRRIGRVEIVSDVPESLVQRVVERLPSLLPN